jgi:hypothetical protein
MMSVTIKPFMLNAIMLNVVMLIVVSPNIDMFKRRVLIGLNRFLQTHL